MWAYGAVGKRSEAADPWSIYDSENHDAQAESFNLLAAQAFKDRGDYRLRTYAGRVDPRRSSTRRGTTTGATTSTSAPSAGSSSKWDHRRTTAT